MKDTKHLPVLFRTFKGELCAYFPTLKWDSVGNITCYAHVGQHGAASPVWLHKGKRATPEQYADLLAELRGIYETEPAPVILRVYARAPRHSSAVYTNQA